ncbi:MAG: helix-turn-helix transcriptional regulator [Gammaproteobacteria bacterium]|nr:helix-turn-helix transcriptional regulator [Gammaproteobacteria bacterium]
MTTKEILVHPSFNYMSNISDIVQPFFGNIKSHFFGHVVVYPNGEYYFLCDKHGWPEKILAQEKLPPIGFTFYDQFADGVTFPSMDKSNVFGWSDEITRESRDQFGIANPMMISRKYEDRNEIFIFDVHHAQAYQKYLENFDLFEKFVHYYKDKSKKMVQKVCQQPLRVANQYLLKPKNTAIMPDFFTSRPSSPLPRRYYLKYQNRDVVLSVKEYYCLSLLAHGKQLKRIASRLVVSLRTVETYFERLKKKLGISSRSELVRAYWQNRILSDQIHDIFF